MKLVKKKKKKSGGGGGVNGKNRQLAEVRRKSLGPRYRAWNGAQEREGESGPQMPPLQGLQGLQGMLGREAWTKADTLFPGGG